MKKRYVYVTVTLTLLIISLNILAFADSPVASFKFKSDKYIDVQGNDYIPINEVADSLNYDLDWKLSNDKVVGTLENDYFYSNNFIIYSGSLYLTRQFYENNFGLNIIIRGNWYFIYRNDSDTDSLEIKVNTNRSSYDDEEAIAVSILFFNKSDELITLKYTSGQKYDLVLEKYNREVWRLSDNKGYIPSINTLKIAAGNYMLFTDIIPADEELSRGNYELYAEVKTSGTTIKSNKVYFNLK